jgi:Eco57I restriction-modification methylase/N-6 DNA Methylase
MELERVLQEIGSLTDLPALIAALGHQPAWEAVPDEAWNKPGSRAFSMAVVGHTGMVPWFAIESRSPTREATLLARRICRRGKLALVLALDSPQRQLALAVAFDRAPGILLDLSRPNREELVSLSRLAGSGEGPGSAFAARAAEALCTEPVGRRFFREFKATLDRMTAGLPGLMTMADRHAIVLLQLTRVLFLYFIQSKGWLAGRTQFLAEEVDRCLAHGRRLDRDFLHPLFFGTLNQPESSRSRTVRQFGVIPFLNGGLFEPHPLERRHRPAIPNPLWRDAFGNLFERFHFTVSESGRAGSVAPDMLGRVFEGVMDPDLRRSSGTFYTPAVLVHGLLEAALVVYLAVRIKCTEREAERRLKDRDPASARILADITVLDPAVGSGAFLLGALEQLSSLGASASPSVRKRHVLLQSLFGVDRNAAAVRLTELRLWLAVIADDPSERADHVHPLPNLDCLVRQGDSLFEPTGLEGLAGAQSLDHTLMAQLSGLRRQVIGATGPEKRVLIRRLGQLEARALGQSLQSAEHRHRLDVASCLEQARAPDLFGQRRGLDPELRNQLASVRLSLRGIRRARRRLAAEREVPWFHYQSAFGDVFARGGFDVVVGNPPWLRSEAMPAALRKQLRERFRWWRGDSRSFGKSPDLAVAFVERGLDLAAPGGVVAMLVPAKIATTGYSAAARHALATTTTLHVLADLTGTAEATFDATVYPLALIAQKSSPSRLHQVRTGLAVGTSKRLLQSGLVGGAPWVLTYSHLHGILSELEHRHPRFSETLTCHLGVKTGLNRLFLNPPPDIEPDLLRWAIRGRDIRAFHCVPKIKLFWTHDERGNVLSRLPSHAQAYVERHNAMLRARQDYQSGPVWTVFRSRAAVSPHRVVWCDLARHLTAAALTGRTAATRIPLNTCYVTPLRSAERAEALAGWLNSTWIRAIARAGAVPASGGFARFNARLIRQLPLPPDVLLHPALTQLARAARKGASVQPELDAVVAHLLGLTPAQQSALRAVGNGADNHR